MTLITFLFNKMYDWAHAQTRPTLINLNSMSHEIRNVQTVRLKRGQLYGQPYV